MTQNIIIGCSVSEQSTAKKLSSTLNKLGIECHLEILNSISEINILDEMLGWLEEKTYLLILLQTEQITSKAPLEHLLEAIKKFKKTQLHVVLCITDAIPSEQIPSELRWSYFLFLNDETNYWESIDSFLKLIKPDAIQIKKFRENLKKSLVVDEYSIQELRHFALERLDLGYDPQSIQCAAICGLERIGGSQSVFILTERVLNGWGCKSIERAIKALFNLRKDGGVLALTATILYDPRYFFIRLRILTQVCEEWGREDSASQLGALSKGNFITIFAKLPGLFKALENIPIDDISNGAKLAHFRKPPVETFNILPWAGALQSVDALLYAEMRVPGLDDLLRKVNIRFDS